MRCGLVVHAAALLLAADGDVEAARSSEPWTGSPPTDLAQRLAVSMKTGTFCRYTPAAQ
jgi:hypothetical protein